MLDLYCFMALFWSLPCYYISSNMVVEAIGQMSDISLLGEDLTERLEWNRGRLQVDENGHTSEPWLWSAGDMVNGPDVIHAVADGHRVSASIEAFFDKQENNQP